MKSDAPKGEDLDVDNDMEEEDMSESENGVDPMTMNKYAEPHGPSAIPGKMNGYAAHISK